MCVSQVEVGSFYDLLSLLGCQESAKNHATGCIFEEIMRGLNKEERSTLKFMKHCPLISGPDLE